MKFLTFLFMFALLPSSGSAFEINTQQIELLIVTCAGSSSKDTRTKLKANLSKYIEVSAEQKSDEQLADLQLLLDGFEDEDIKKDIIEMYQVCMKDMLITISNINNKKESNEKSSTNEDLKPKIKSSAIFESNECNSLSEIENIDELIVYHNASFCDEGRVVLRFIIKNASDKLFLQSSYKNTFKWSYLGDLDIHKITFPNKKLRYFQLPVDAKKDDNEEWYTQINFIPKPTSQ